MGGDGWWCARGNIDSELLHFLRSFPLSRRAHLHPPFRTRPSTPFRTPQTDSSGAPLPRVPPMGPSRLHHMITRHVTSDVRGGETGANLNRIG